MDQPTVVSVDRWSLYRCVSITEVDHGAAYSGLCRQVVLIQRCVSITEVVHGAAYSGLCRQVVLNRGVLVSLRWSTDQPAVVSVDRWSLYRGVLVSLRWSMDQIITECRAH